MLHTFPVRERDKLVVLLTPGYGKLKGWAYGARGARNRFGASLEPLAKVQLSFLEREGEEIVRIESVDLLRSLFPVQQQLAGSVAASFIAEMIDTFALPSDPAELLYRLLDSCLDALLHDAPVFAVVAYAELWTLRLAGVFPSTRSCIRCQGPISRPMRFDDQLFGFTCHECASRESRVIRNDVSDAIDQIQRLPVRQFAASGHPDEVLFEIRALTGALRRHFLGRELKSFDILMSLAPR